MLSCATGIVVNQRHGWGLECLPDPTNGSASSDSRTQSPDVFPESEVNHDTDSAMNNPSCSNKVTSET